METERLTEVVSLRFAPSTLDALLAIGQAQPIAVDVIAVIRQAVAEYVAGHDGGNTGREQVQDG